MSEDTITLLETIHERDTHTNRQTPHDGTDHAYA